MLDLHQKNSNSLLYHKDNVEQLIEEVVSREVAINYVCDMKAKNIMKRTMLLNQPMRACLKYVCYKKKMTKHVLNNKKDTSVHF